MATKAELCLEIYKQLQTEFGEDNFKAIRPKFIERAVADAGCTPAGAATYYANCKSRGGATGEVRTPGVQRDPNYVSPYANKRDNDKPDSRSLYSAVQRDKQGLVARVAGYYNPVDALARAKLVRGYAVMGFPDVGEDITTLTAFDQAAIMECGSLDIDKVFDIEMPAK